MTTHQTLTPTQLEDLIRTPPGRAVSVFLPTRRSRTEAARNRQVLQSLLKQAREQLEALGCSRSEAEAQLEQAHSWCAAPDFWAGCLDGMAFYVQGGNTRAYRVPFELPEFVTVGEHLHTKPLLPLLSAGDGFWLLALSRNSVRLFRGDLESLTEADVPGVEGLTDLDSVDIHERQLHSHAGSRQGRSGQPTATFHGHGGTGTDDPKVREQRFCKAAAAAVEAVLADSQAPLVLAGVSSLLATYRRAASYSHLAPGELHGNHEHVDEKALHAQALGVVPPFVAVRARSAARFNEAGARAVDDVVQAWTHARAGRLDLLFVAADACTWATLDGDGAPTLHTAWEPGAVDLLDQAAAETRRHGGTVHCVVRADLPDPGAPVAGVLRY